jgi:hypothetical protein
VKGRLAVLKSGRSEGKRIAVPVSGRSEVMASCTSEWKK